MIGHFLLLMLQTGTAVPTTDVPLERGQWVWRETVQRETGAGGVSASLMSQDGAYRLVVRCDYAYDRTLSIQLLRVDSEAPRIGIPAILQNEAESLPFALEWEQAEAGVFARSSFYDEAAHMAARRLATIKGDLVFVGTETRSGQRRQLRFAGRTGHSAIDRTISACS